MTGPEAARGRSAGDRVAAALRVLAASGVELDAQELLDVLWLAPRLPATDAAPLRPYAAPEQDSADDGNADVAPGTAGSPSADSTTPIVQPPPTTGELYAAGRQAPDLLPPRRGGQQPAPPAGAGGAAPDKPVRPIRVPEARSSLQQLSAGRSLRPLRRRQDSRHRFEVDEQRTAAALAESRLPDAVLRPAQERWLRLVLVVDDGLSMLLWHQVTTEIKQLMLRLGAFASVRVLGLDSRGADGPRLHSKPFKPRSAPVSTASLLDHSGRTLILVVSDGMGSAWRSGTLHRALDAWARRGPVGLLHTLPPPLWESSGIRAERWQATTRRVGGPNASWDITDPLLPRDLARFDGVPVPVLEPDAVSLGAWAALLSSPGGTAQLPLLSPPARHAPTRVARSRDSVQHFRDSATPEAYRLAAHLAAVSPVSVPVMHLVQQAVPWQARTSHLAEVFLGGLVRPHPAPEPDPPPKHRVFEFTDEARTALLDAVPHAELLRTGRRIGRQLEQLAGRNADFPAWLAQPDGTATVPAALRPFTTVEQRLLRRFGVGSRTGPDASRSQSPDADADPATWSTLTRDDPRHIGPYRLVGRRRGGRTLVYLALDRAGNRLVVRTTRRDAPPESEVALRVERSVLARLSGRYAPRLLDSGVDAGRPWHAMELLADPEGPDIQPPRLNEVLNRALAEGRPPFDTLQALTVGHQLASALSTCHLDGVVLGDLSPESVMVLRRSVVLCDLSDCVVDGTYERSGPMPTPAENVRALGELLQLVSSKQRLRLAGLSDRMHLWQGDTWEPLRRLVRRCLDDDPAARPSAGEAEDVLARYLALHNPGESQPVELPPVRAPLTIPEPQEPALDAQPLKAQLPRLRGITRGRSADPVLDTLRAPRTHTRRITLIGAHPHSGRSTATLALGSLLAVVRGEPVLAVDGAPDAGSLSGYLPGDRNRATLRDVATLAPGASYEEVRACTTRLPTGLEVVAHRPGHFTPSTTHAVEYTRLVAAATPYYPVLLTDWGAKRPHSGADPVLALTDRLVLCCTVHRESTLAAGELLTQLRDRGHASLVDSALVLVAEVDGSAVPDAVSVSHRLGLPGTEWLAIPFEPAFAGPGFPTLRRLSRRTASAFANAAARLLESDSQPDA